MFGPLHNYEILREKTCCCFNARHPDPTCLMCLNVFSPLPLPQKSPKAKADIWICLKLRYPQLGKHIQHWPVFSHDLGVNPL